MFCAFETSATKLIRKHIITYYYKQNYGWTQSTLPESPFIFRDIYSVSILKCTHIGIHLESNLLHLLVGNVKNVNAKIAIISINIPISLYTPHFGVPSKIYFMNFE